MGAGQGAQPCANAEPTVLHVSPQGQGIPISAEVARAGSGAHVVGAPPGQGRWTDPVICSLHALAMKVDERVRFWMGGDVYRKHSKHGGH